MMLIFNILSQLNAMDINEAIEYMDEMASFHINPETDMTHLFFWDISVIRHGKIENTQIYLINDRFVVDIFIYKHAELYKFYHIDNVFAEQVIARINVAINIELNYKLN